MQAPGRQFLGNAGRFMGVPGWRSGSDRPACPPRAGFWALLWLCLFPVTVFLGAPYTESLFLLTTAMALEMVRRKKWLFAGIWGMLAALTRNVGVLTSLAFITGYLMDFRERVGRVKPPGEGSFRLLSGAAVCGAP